MRLCWNDSGLIVGNMTVEQAKKFYDIGFRVVGIAGIQDYSDAAIDRAKKVLHNADIMPGPIGGGGAALRPDSEETKQHRERIIRALRVGGKLGCTGVRVSIGSMHPTNVWMHHPENITQKAMDMLVENVRLLKPIAEDAQCALCPETTQWTVVNSINRMKEFVDRVDSPFVRIVFDPVNHMTYDRVYNSGSWIKQAIAYLGDCIGEFHVKDVTVQDKHLVSHIDEAPMGTGLLDHAALMQASNQLEPWKTFSLEHIRGEDLLIKAHKYIQSVARSIGHKWTDPKLDRAAWERQNGK